jgi:hypothetical protein
MTRGHPLRALVVAAVGLLGLDAVLLVLAGVWLDRAGLIAWGVVLGLLAALPIGLWRRYVRQMDEVRGARHAMAQELRHLQQTLRETQTDAVTAGEPRR